MGYRLDKTGLDTILEKLSVDYQVFAPAPDRTGKKVRFRQITSSEEIVTDRQSDFSIKEAYYPVSQVMMYFRTDHVEEAGVSDPRKILIIARPCDINSIRRLDKIFCENGAQDYYYTRLREKVRFVLLECKESFDDCFCVSAGSNVTDDHVMALRLERDSNGSLDDILVSVSDSEFAPYFEGSEEADFRPEFVKQNKKSLRIPDITRDKLKAISDLDYWQQFDERCIGCGGCNTVCGTCSCFDTSDIIYEEGRSDGERRRVWSSCMLADFTRTAGGARSRKSPGANMRFKVFHKFFDFKARFGEEHMCVGCGRCDMHCPKDISFFDTVDRLNDAIASAGGAADDA